MHIRWGFKQMTEESMKQNYQDIFGNIDKTKHLRSITAECIVSSLLGREVQDYLEISDSEIGLVMKKYLKLFKISGEILRKLLQHDLLFCENCKYSIEIDEQFNSDESCNFKLIVQKT